jgi:Chaperone of endosialidase
MISWEKFSFESGRQSQLLGKGKDMDNVPMGPPPPPPPVSDIRLKRDITLLGRLNDGLGFYRFTYNGGHTAYVGVMAQEVQTVMPEAVVRGTDGYLRVFYDKLGLKFQTYDEWVASGGRMPAVTSVTHKAPGTIESGRQSQLLGKGKDMDNVPMGPPPPPPPTSDIRLKHDITLLGRLNDGLGFYRFTYNGGHTAYVGVMAQEVQTVMPEAVVRGSDGYLRVFYDKLGLKFQTYDEWVASGGRMPAVTSVTH